MIEINLLPKELQRKAKGMALGKNAFYLIGGVIGLFVLFFLISFWQKSKLNDLNRKIASAKKRTEELKKDIQLIEGLEEIKSKLLRRMDTIEALDKNRDTWVEILEDLSSRVPEYLWLSSLEEVASQVSAAQPQDTTLQTEDSSMPSSVTIQGYTYSINSLASFLIRLMKSDYFKNVELEFIKTAQLETQKVFSFQLKSELIYTSQMEGWE